MTVKSRMASTQMIERLLAIKENLPVQYFKIYIYRKVTANNAGT